MIDVIVSIGENGLLRTTQVTVGFFLKNIIKVRISYVIVQIKVPVCSVL